MLKKFILQNIFVGLIIVGAGFTAFAQTTAFNYQGKLTDTGTSQSIYQMQFRLYGSAGGADQIGGTITDTNVAVNQGVFNVQLDFGAPAFSGVDIFLQIAVRRSAAESYVTLNPRQQINSSPYSIRTLSAAQADIALDANKLGGVDASQYVTTTSVGSSFIKNATTQQTGSFNINGNGIIGGNVGIGTPSPQSKLDVNGTTLVRTGGTGGNVQIGNPNGESGITIANSNRADIKFDNSTLRLVAGSGTTPPLNTNGISISTTGNVGVGVASPSARLEVFSPVSGTTGIYSESASGRGVWGKSTSSRGIYGESSSLEGVYGISSSGTGVAGRSTSNSGVYGESNAASLTAGGVYGKGTGSGSIGVIGESNTANAVGVYGSSTSSTGFGMYAKNTAGGRAVFAEGNVAQALNSNGLVKAMIVVANGAIVRCYNGVTNSSTGNCGFVVTTPLYGVSRINYGFLIGSRFVSVTCRFGIGFSATTTGANYRIFDSTSLEVFTYLASDAVDTYPADEFTVIMF